ncbi:MAG TPA: DUF2059 domain-containing protein [Rariglobus sp.]
MKFIKIVTVILLLSSGGLLQAEIDKAKRQEIETMLKLTGMERIADQMMAQMIQGMSVNMKGMPPEFWQRFSQKIRASELIERIIPLYDKYYSLEDLRAVNAFYSSPAGQRVLQTLPQIMQESMKIGQEWGREIGERAAAEVMAEMKDKKKPGP